MLGVDRFMQGGEVVTTQGMRSWNYNSTTVNTEDVAWFGILPCLAWNCSVLQPVLLIFARMNSSSCMYVRICTRDISRRCVFNIIWNLQQILLAGCQDVRIKLKPVELNTYFMINSRPHNARHTFNLSNWLLYQQMQLRYVKCITTYL